MFFQGYDFSDFFDTSTMQSGPKGTAASEEEKRSSTRVEGFGLFEKGDIHLQPGFDPPVAVKKIIAEREEKLKQQQQQQEEKIHA